MVLVQAPRGPGRPDPHGPGQPGAGRHRRREAAQTHAFCPPSTLVTPPWTRPPSPEPGPWWASRATSPFVPAHLMDVGEVVSSYHVLWQARSVFPDEQARPESPTGLPPHSRRHLGPPDRSDGLPSRSPLHPGHHRDQHQTRHPRPQTPTGRHHQPQRPPPRSRTASDRRRQRHPHCPEHPTPGTLSVMSQA